jgi:hypothetical protein
MLMDQLASLIVTLVYALNAQLQISVEAQVVPRMMDKETK